MKKILILLCLVFFSCSPDGANNGNPHLPNVGFSKEINTNFPAYNSLKFVSNPIIITDVGVGVKGIVVMKVGEGVYNAFEVSCPSHEPSSCSQMAINGINVKCSCENYEYSLYSGAAVNGGTYPLKYYRTEVMGDIIRVYN
ncbi:Rieske (2Fe-2S) protein [Flavobacterium sp. GCM10023249]|uniref:Rieske (2Fe-2S) protein n=1 Tax=unclassified Flavobacterium TaxID=196869 RepID=UPI003620A442